MTFLVPALAIAGAVSMAIPIIIHLLLRQRRRPIEWAAMRFLIEAFKRQKRRMQLEQWLLLASRCLILGLLGAALARPALQAAGILEAGGSRAIYLVIDDGLAGGVKPDGPDGQTALAKHVADAEAIINELRPGDVVGVITAGEPVRALIVPPTGDHAAVKKALHNLTPTESRTNFAAALRLVRQTINNQREGLPAHQTIVYAFSEFRQGSAALDEALPDVLKGLGEDVTLLASPAAETPVSNIQVTAVDAVRYVLLPGTDDGSEQVTVRLRRTGGLLERELSRVRLTGPDVRHIPPKDVAWSPGQSTADVEFRVDVPRETERRLGFGAAIDADALAADDQRYAVLDVRSRIRLLVVDRREFGLERSVDQLTAGQWVRRALAPSDRSVMDLAEVEPAALDVADLRTADVVVLPRPDLLEQASWMDLRRFVDRGGLLIIMPPAELNVHQWVGAMEQALAPGWRIGREVAEDSNGRTLAAEQPASDLLRLISSELSELAQPVVTTRWLPTTDVRGSARALVTFSDGSPLVVAGAPGEAMDGAAIGSPEAASSNGLVVYFAAAPELAWTNLPSKPLMVPLMQELVRQGLSTIRASIGAQVGERPVVGLAGVAAELVSGDGARLAVGRDGRVDRPITRSGLYQVQDAAKVATGLVAVNVPVDAGRTDAQSQAAVSTWLATSGPWRTFDAADLTAALRTEAVGSPLSGTLLIIVIVLVLAEMLTARWFSHAMRERRSMGINASGTAGGGGALAAEGGAA